MDFDVIVLGAGAAGMMCAAVAGRRGRRVLLIEHAVPLGEKIRISGGGRCNFTNLHSRPEAFLSRNPDFPRSALARYTPQDFIALIERHGIRYHEKTLGQLFCDGSSEQIIQMLSAETLRAQVLDPAVPANARNGIPRVDPIPALAGITVTGGRLNVDRAVRDCTGAPYPDPDPPLPPTNLEATGGNGQVVLSWSASSEIGRAHV